MAEGLVLSMLAWGGGRGGHREADAERTVAAFSCLGPPWAGSPTAVPSVSPFRLRSSHLHAARRLQPVCGGVQEKPLQHLDHETLRQSPGEGHLSDQQALADQKVVPGQQNVFVSAGPTHPGGFQVRSSGPPVRLAWGLGTLACFCRRVAFATWRHGRVLWLQSCG